MIWTIRHPYIRFWVIILIASSLSASVIADERAIQQNQDSFVVDVLPILRQSCFECHSHASGESNGGLMLDSLAAMQAGGSRGPSLSATNPDASLILSAVSYSDADLQMPPAEKLAAKDVDAIRRWIAGGAHVPDIFLGDAAQRSEAEVNAATDRWADHWAYLPLRSRRSLEDNPTSPSPAATRLDEILLAKLAEQQLVFSPRADRRTLIRRLHYDLTGLPPSMDAIQRIMEDHRPDHLVLEQFADQLLSSPHFGERFARYWMDVARYADNKGYVFQEDREYAEAYRYRDWLIDAFNADMPYDDFVAQQLAADLLADDGDHSNLPALGFITLGRRFINNKLDIIDDRLDVVTRGLMGMTLACARCHDHKYDPITQVDYYSLAGIFLNSNEPGDGPWPHRLQDAEQLQDSYVLYRGSPSNRGPKVERKFVSFLAKDQRPFESQGSGRAELAARIASPSNPLTARVFANRIWMRLMGSSLVETPSDFGMRCPEPVQLQLLDELALTLIESGWSIKALVRQIILSECYTQASLDRPEASVIDPENALYWKMNRRRLDFEALRDTFLACTDNLDRQVRGKSVNIHEAPYSHRRTVYAYIDRQNLPSIFRTFDMASPDTHSARRAETSVPQQGLFLLNSDFVMGRSEELASRLAEQATTQGDRAAIEMAFEVVLRREPTAEESRLINEYLDQSAEAFAELRADARAKPDSKERRESFSPWAQVVQILLATNELAFVD